MWAGVGALVMLLALGATFASVMHEVELNAYRAHGQHVRAVVEDKGVRKAGGGDGEQVTHRLGLSLAFGADRAYVVVSDYVSAPQWEALSPGDEVAVVMLWSPVTPGQSPLLAHREPVNGRLTVVLASALTRGWMWGMRWALVVMLWGFGCFSMYRGVRRARA